MKWFAVIFALAGALLALGQTAESSLFTSIRPQVSVSVASHPVGSQLVDIVLLDPGYPASTLSDQIARLGAELKSPINGLRLYTEDFGGDAAKGLPKASFGVSGLIDHKTGELKIAPIVRALTGAPAGHAITGISIIFQNLQPTSNTIERYRSSMVEVDSTVHAGSIGIEYRIKLLTQDPGKIDIPEGGPKPPVPPQPKPPAKPDWTLWGFIGLAALATGALVYFAIARPKLG